jgi:ABC-type Na+ efflux pump permease subunit
MPSASLSNIWLVIKREYLERVRQRSFIVLTVLLPAIMIGGAFFIPAKLSSMKSSKMQRLVVVTSDRKFGEIVRQQLLASSQGGRREGGADKDKDKDDKDEDDDKSSRDYTIDVDSTPSEAERTALQNRVTPVTSTVTCG